MLEATKKKLQDADAFDETKDKSLKKKDKKKKTKWPKMEIVDNKSSKAEKISADEAQMLTQKESDAEKGSNNTQSEDVEAENEHKNLKKQVEKKNTTRESVKTSKKLKGEPVKAKILKNISSITKPKVSPIKSNNTKSPKQKV